MKSLLRKTATVVGATVVGGLASLGLAAPALAAPGDAEARGLVVELAAEVEGVTVLDLDLVAGTATAPPDGGTDASSLADLDVSGLGAQVTADLVEVSATRGADESSAEASVTGADLDLFGGQVLAAATATATATCPAVGDQTAETTLTGLEVFGDAVVLDANTPPVVVSAAVIVPGLTDAALEVSLTRIEEVTDDGAAAAAVVAELTLTGTVDGLDVEIPAGTVILAEAVCERPVGPPVATGITPDEGPQSGGQTVTITGSGFVPDGTTVTFDGAEATDVVVSDDGTSLTAVTPPGAVGPAEVVVTTVAGSSDPLDYTYLADGSDAVVTDLDPTEGPTTGGTRVTITGSGFTGATGVTFDGIPGTEFTVDADGETITVVTPPHAAGPVPVEIIFPAGTADAGTFTYLAAGPPVIDSMDPDGGPTTGGTVVTIVGSGFVPGATTVTICAVTIPADQVEVSDDGTVLTFVTPPCAAGPTEVVVTTPAGSSAAATFWYGDPLPNTGTPVWQLLVAGLTLVLGGIGLLTLVPSGRRRRMLA